MADSQESDAADDKDPFGLELHNTERILRSPKMHKAIVMDMNNLECQSRGKGGRVFWKLYKGDPVLNRFLTGQNRNSIRHSRHSELLQHLMDLRNAQQLKDWQEHDRKTSALMDDAPTALSASSEESSPSKSKARGREYSFMAKCAKTAQFPTVDVKLQVEDEEMIIAMKAEMKNCCAPSVEFSAANVRALYLWYWSHPVVPCKSRRSRSSESGTKKAKLSKSAEDVDNDNKGDRLYTMKRNGKEQTIMKTRIQDEGKGRKARYTTVRMVRQKNGRPKKPRLLPEKSEKGIGTDSCPGSPSSDF